MSGSSYSSWALVEEPVIYAIKLAKELNCSIPEDVFKDHEIIVNCLRDVSLEDLYSVDIQPPNFLSAFGPSVDGVVIRPGRSNQDLDENSRASKRNLANVGQYDLMISVVTGEALWRFSASDIQSGFESDRRDKIIRTYVRNAYNYHLSEIFYTIVSCKTCAFKSLNFMSFNLDNGIYRLGENESTSNYNTWRCSFCIIRRTICSASCSHGWFINDSHECTWGRREPKMLLFSLWLSNKRRRLSTAYGHSTWRGFAVYFWSTACRWLCSFSKKLHKIWNRSFRSNHDLLEQFCEDRVRMFTLFAINVMR